LPPYSLAGYGSQAADQDNCSNESSFIMNIAVHVTFYYIESRLEYINRIIKNLSGISHNIRVFIYSNRKFDLYPAFENIEIEVVPFNFLDDSRNLKSLYRFIPLALKQHIDPYYLAWKNRACVERLIDQYDAQIYLEDDIGFTNKTFEYWMKYKDVCIRNDFNLGFLRFEVDEDNNKLFCTDLSKVPQKIINIEKQLFLLNDINVYCGFWIYDKKELKEFTKTEEWSFKFKKYKKYKVREKSAIGWHGVNMKRYQGTVIPLQLLQNNTYVIHNDCKVHHFPNNYIGHGWYCSVEFPIRLKLKSEDMMKIA
jgi:hypothetical protein